MTARGTGGWGASPRILETVEIALAYGVFLAVTSIALWGDIPYVRADDGWSQSPDMAGFLIREASFALSFAIAAVCAWRFPRASAWRGEWVAFGLLVAGLSVGFVFGQSGAPYVAISSALLGTGCSFVFCLLQDRVTTLCGVYRSGQVVFSAAAISAVLYFILKVIPAGTPSLCAFLALLACLFVFLVRAGSAGHRYEYADVPPSSVARELRCVLGEIWKPMVCVSLSAFIIGMIRLRAAMDAPLLAQVNDSAMIGLLVAAACLALLWKAIYSRVALLTLHQVLFPLIASAYLLLPVFSGDYEALFTVLANIVFSIASSLMVVNCVASARRRHLRPVAVYGVFAGVVYSALMLGSVAGFALGIERDVSQVWMFVIAMVALYAMAMLLVLPRRETSAQDAYESAGGSQESEYVSHDQEPMFHEVDGHESEVVSTPTFTIEQKCALLAAEGKLSRREAEIFVYLAKGRDVQFIANELVLSKNTVKTHIKNLFYKLNVHSRQELIDLVEGFTA